MSTRARYEDLTTLLYMFPFVAAVGYAILLWAETGASAFLPASAYLTVTRDPTLFILGSLAVLLGLMIEVNGTDPSARPAKLASLGGTLQSIAVASLAIVLLSVWYANGFTDLGGAGTDFLLGRYGLVFPAVMVLLSYLLTARFRLGALANQKAIALIALLLVPVTVREIGKRELAVGMLVSLLRIVAGLYLFLFPIKRARPEKQE